MEINMIQTIFFEFVQCTDILIKFCRDKIYTESLILYTIITYANNESSKI